MLEKQGYSIKKSLIDLDLLEIEKQVFHPKSQKNLPDKFYLLQPNYNAEDLISQTSQVQILDISGSLKTKPNKDNNSSDTIKDTNSWDFLSNKYSKEIVNKQNEDLLRCGSEHLKKYLNVLAPF